MSIERLRRQLAFTMEADKLKSVLRRTLTTDEERRENSAEHSWHLALMSVVLEEYAAKPVNRERVVEMVLVHDIVEIDAGDTFAYDASANIGKADRERVAAVRLFGLLPADQCTRFRDLWEEFELMQTADAKFANALDRMQPLLQNHYTNGGTWRMNKVTRSQVLSRMEPIRDVLPAAWPFVTDIVEENCRLGHIMAD